MQVSLGQPNGFLKPELKAGETKLFFGQNEPPDLDYVITDFQKKIGGTDEEAAAASAMKRKVLLGYIKQVLKLNFSFFGALKAHGKILERVEPLYSAFDEDILVNREELSVERLRLFISTLRGEAEGAQKLFISLGAEKETVSFKNGRELLVTSFNLLDDEDLVKNPFIALDELADLKEIAKSQNNSLKELPLDEIFIKLDQVALPEKPLSEAIETLKELEELLS